MTGRKLIAAWIATVVLIVVGLIWTVDQWVALGSMGTTAVVENARLSRELDTQREAIQTDLLNNAALLRDIRWSPERATPEAVVRRLAALAHGGQAKVFSIAPLESESTPRYRKSWHRIEMAAPFAELVAFAGKVEQEGGNLEEIVVEPGTGDVRAQFRLSAMEPSEEVKKILARTLAASKKAGDIAPLAALALPIDGAAVNFATGLRDPFTFVPRAAAKVAATPTILPPPLLVKGIVKFPGGNVAILNDQTVAVGDVVEGQRVEEIGNNRVVLKPVNGGSATAVVLPGLATMSSPPKRP
jgi:hypothetical protein